MKEKEFSLIEIKTVQEMNNIRIMASAVALAELSSFHGHFFSMFYHHNFEPFIKELVVCITFQAQYKKVCSFPFKRLNIIDCYLCHLHMHALASSFYVCLLDARYVLRTMPGTE